MFRVIRQLCAGVGAVGNTLKKTCELIDIHLDALIEEGEITSKILSKTAIQKANVHALVTMADSLIAIRKAKTIITDANQEELAEYEALQKLK